MLLEEVVPRLVARRAPGDPARVVRSRTLRTTGVPESALAERVAPVEGGLPPLSLAYLPGLAGVDLRLTAWGVAPEEADALLERGAARLRAVLGSRCYGEEDDDLAALVLERLRRDGERLAVAESCTGGLLGGRLTAIPGASDVFVGGVIAYDDAVKRALLDVPGELLERHGAVSEETVSAMAQGAQRRFGTACALAVTGIAGPSGGTPDKPVGTVWLAARRGETTRVVRRVFPGPRDNVRARSAQAALDLLRLLLAEAPG